MHMKPCPFCGGTPYINRWHSETGTSIKCKDCGCTTQIENGEKAAIEVWNKRSYDESSERIALMQYDSLRKNFQQLITDVLGKGYYNEGMDVYTCDEFSCRDLKAKANRKWYQRLGL